VPFADNSTHPIPDQVGDDQMILLADILPTAYEVGVLNGKLRPADVVAIVGAGPIGLAAVLAAKLLSPSHIVVIDRVDARLDIARKIGADITINNADQDPAEVIESLTDGVGADVTMEAVGIPATFDLAVSLARPGGHIANIGVHGEPVTLHLEDLWIKNLTLTTGLVDTRSTPTLIKLVASRQIDTSSLVTHRFALSDIEQAYGVFSDAASSGALKVLLSNDAGVR
jgi:alcohol dehydrogenase